MLEFEFYFRQLEVGLNINETCFYFKDDEEETEYYIGYLPQHNKPYWAGYCDIKDGCEFNSAEELINAKIYNGKSLFERWDNVMINTIEGVDIKDWLQRFEHC